MPPYQTQTPTHNSLHDPLPQNIEVIRAKQTKRLPSVFTREEVQAIPTHIDGVHHLVLSLLYGTGMRLYGRFALTRQGYCFARKEITVRETKGDREGKTMLPAKLVDRLHQQLEYAKALHKAGFPSNWGDRTVHSPLDA